MLPLKDFFGFDRPESGTAPVLAKGLLAVVDILETAGGTFGGMSSDAPAVMVGKDGGVGVLVMEKKGFCRHDLCEHHASGRLLAILEKVFPPRMNIASPTQFWYLAWYILNSDWNVFRGRIVKYLNENPAQALLERFPGDNKKNAALAALGKPEKPMSARWRTLADTMVFVDLFLEALQHAFEEERQVGGVGAPTGSIAAMCTQWLKWSGSEKLRALCSMALEYMTDVWRPFDEKIGFSNQEFDLDGCNHVTYRPRRVLEQLTLIERCLADIQNLKSYSRVLAAFGNDCAGEVSQLYSHLYQLAKESVLRNSGRYLSGIYAFGGMADPDFAPVVFEALSYHFSKGKPRQTRDGKKLLAFFKSATLCDAEKEELEQLVRGNAWSSVTALMSALNKSRHDFVALISSATKDNHVLWSLKCWQAALSNTQVVEKTFLDHDHQTRGTGNMKGKASEPAGKGASTVTTEARVLIKSVMNKNIDSILAQRKEPKKDRHVTKIEDIISLVDVDTKALFMDDKEFKEGAAAAKEAHDYYRVPRQGLSKEITLVFENLQKEVEGFVGPRLQFESLLKSGAAMDVSLSTECTADCLQIEKLGQKGRKPASVVCVQCERSYHIPCMISEAVLPRDINPADLTNVQFCCGSCDGTAASNAPQKGASSARAVIATKRAQHEVPRAKSHPPTVPGKEFGGATKSRGATKSGGATNSNAKTKKREGDELVALDVAARSLARNDGNKKGKQRQKRGR